MTDRNGAPALYTLARKHVFVAGHRGMVGSAIARHLAAMDCRLTTASSGDVDMTRQAETEAFLAKTKPDVVIVAAARVGGIQANNSLPADFLYDNLAIAANLIHGSHSLGVEKLLFLGSSCIYPKHAPQPLNEDALLTGPLEPTNEWYAVAKIAGIKLCQAYRRQHGADFISLMPTNLYGPGDNYHPEHSHVIAALLRRFHEAKETRAPEVIVWGTGTPRREFLYVEELADAAIFALEHYSGEQHLNAGTGIDLSIAELAKRIAETVGYHGAIRFDASKPDGTPRKLMDVSRLSALGWQARMSLDDGLKHAYADFLSGGGRNRHSK